MTKIQKIRPAHRVNDLPWFFFPTLAVAMTLLTIWNLSETFSYLGNYTGWRLAAEVIMTTICTVGLIAANVLNWCLAITGIKRVTSPKPPHSS